MLPNNVINSKKNESGSLFNLHDPSFVFKRNVRWIVYLVETSEAGWRSQSKAGRLKPVVWRSYCYHLTQHHAIERVEQLLLIATHVQMLILMGRGWCSGTINPFTAGDILIYRSIWSRLTSQWLEARNGRTADNSIV